MFSQGILVSILAAASVVAPTDKRTPVYGPKFQGIAIHSGDLRVHQHGLSASDGFIYIGKNTTTPSPAGTASMYSESTSFVFQGSASAISTVKMNTDNPDGVQELFGLSDGSLSYGTPGDLIPNDGYAGPWDYSFENDSGSLTFEEEIFWACPVAAPEYEYPAFQVYAQAVTPEGADRSACIDVAIGTFTYTGKPAYEYTV